MEYNLLDRLYNLKHFNALFHDMMWGKKNINKTVVFLNIFNT